MTGPDAAVAAVRRAVRAVLPPSPGALAVACSGGPDSLALAAAALHEAPGRVHGLIVDHQLQPGSGRVAATTAATLTGLGAATATVLTVTPDGPGGPEARARRARYLALAGARPPGAPVLLGHTADDQAETVLLGLGRGSGARSLAGMRVVDPPWLRPLLGLRRQTTVAACAALGLRPWCDPHNSDPRFTRVRLRAEVLPLLEEVLAGGVAAALARTAAQLRDDTDALDELAAALHADATRPAHAPDTAGPAAGGSLDVATLAGAPAALRRRVLRRWLLESGTPEVSDAHLRAVDGLVCGWHGQGPLALPGGLRAGRTGGPGVAVLTVSRPVC
jgi:tRNA(Ile)-lysidine synthase